MTFRLYDRVSDAATTTGTGAFTLANTVVPGFLRFSDIPSITSADMVPYVAVNSATTPQQWETGYGSYASGVLSRTIITGTNSGGIFPTATAVSFTNAPSVFLDMPANSLAALGSQPVPLVSGRWYFTAVADTANPISASTYYTPLMLPTPATAVSIGLQVTSSSTANTIYFGVYSDNGGKPGTRIGSAGSVAFGGSAGAVAATVSIPLPPGLCWLAASWATSNLTVQTCGQSGPFGTSPLAAMMGASSISNAAKGLGYIGYTDVSGTLPTTPTGSLAVYNQPYAPFLAVQV